MHAHICCVIELRIFCDKFQRTTNEELAIFNVESWLHHGEKLQQRFQLASYKMMNQLLKTWYYSQIVFVWKYNQTVEAEIHIIAINSVCFFASENKATFEIIQNRIKKVSYQEIVSIHGHDAFDRIQTITQFAGYF
jgi:homoserine O-acetyltransferase